MRKLIPVLLTMISVLVSGCFNEDDATTVAIYAEPSSKLVKPGDMVYLDVYVTTLNNAVTDVTMTTFDSEHGREEIHKTNPQVKSYQERIIWQIPAMSSDTTLIEVNICAKDDPGVSNDLTLMMMATGGSSCMLQERSGFTIYSPMSGKPDAFSFTTLQPLQSSSGSKDCDLMFIHDGNGDTLPLTWGTATDIVYCKANNYDYAGATWAGVQSVFTNSLRSDSVTGLQIDDIILIGREQFTEDDDSEEVEDKNTEDSKVGSLKLSTLGVIKIMAIYDEEGVNNDRIVFNLKTL